MTPDKPFRGRGVFCRQNYTELAPPLNDRLHPLRALKQQRQYLESIAAENLVDSEAAIRIVWQSLNRRGNGLDSLRDRKLSDRLRIQSELLEHVSQRSCAFLDSLTDPDVQLFNSSDHVLELDAGRFRCVLEFRQ